ncbi:hypothetical protein P9239_12225 [Caballeronia sp. LZ062]|uniref:hypothetical protein n=1 Tax=unclassified Caballeronia TaxID=2646786 RepID=UPI002856621F|nr:MULTISPECIES: hypothetical protein [unclassified Caballeronia]MDR5854359.1 hypothetical protein [Caballeronia sp. LZ050]MDR5871110.1 hypothetical protein [Caballeronia sp. LZ062]
MKPLLRVVLVVNAFIFLVFGVLFLLTPWAGLYDALQLDAMQVEPAFAGQLLGIALIGFAWLSLHAAIDGALTTAAARASGHVEWLSGIVVLVWLLGLRTPEVDGFGQVGAALLGIVLLVLGLGSVRLAGAVRRRERAARAGAASAERAEKKAAQKQAAQKRDETPTPATAVRPTAHAPQATAIDPVTGHAVDPAGRPLDSASPAARTRVQTGVVDPVTGRTLDAQTGREIDPATGRRIDPVIGSDIDPATGRRVDPLTGRVAPDPASGAPR